MLLKRSPPKPLMIEAIWRGAHIASIEWVLTALWQGNLSKGIPVSLSIVSSDSLFGARNSIGIYSGVLGWLIHHLTAVIHHLQLQSLRTIAARLDPVAQWKWPCSLLNVIVGLGGELCLPWTNGWMEWSSIGCLRLIESRPQPMTTLQPANGRLEPREFRNLKKKTFAILIIIQPNF